MRRAGEEEVRRRAGKEEEEVRRIRAGEESSRGLLWALGGQSCTVSG